MMTVYMTDMGVERVHGAHTSRCDIWCWQDLMTVYMTYMGVECIALMTVYMTDMGIERVHSLDDGVHDRIHGGRESA